jgi:acyl-CoA synthetase (AMP-forming)/AMP-acid ligase II
LVHRGALVALGYWNAPAATAERFRPLPGLVAAGGKPEMAVWSGDTVVKDEDGFLFFRGRRDNLIKTSGYRVSPEEIEQLVMKSGLVSEAVVFGIPDSQLGQIIGLVAVPTSSITNVETLLTYCKQKLPAYMVPRHLLLREQLPRNANGKFDRTALKAEMQAR